MRGIDSPPLPMRDKPKTKRLSQSSPLNPNQREKGGKPLACFNVVTETREFAIRRNYDGRYWKPVMQKVNHVVEIVDGMAIVCSDCNKRIGLTAETRPPHYDNPRRFVSVRDGHLRRRNVETVPVVSPEREGINLDTCGTECPRKYSHWGKKSRVRARETNQVKPRNVARRRDRARKLAMQDELLAEG